VKTKAVTVGVVLAAGIAWAAAAPAETVTFRLLRDPSRATFKSDAPLETFVGNTTSEGIEGTLVVDPARPPAKVRGILTVKQKPAERVADELQLETGLTFVRAR
jgi:hypothetical protein